MATDVVIPKLGMGMDAITIVQWMKSVGDQVDSGEPLVEVTTDKVNIEVSSTSSGVLLRQLFFEGERVPADTVVGYIGEAGEELVGLKAREVPGRAKGLDFSGVQYRFNRSADSDGTDEAWGDVGRYLTRREKKMYQATALIQEKVTGLSEDVGQLDKVLLRLCDFQLELIQDVRSLRQEVSQLRQQHEQVVSLAVFRKQDSEVAASATRSDATVPSHVAHVAPELEALPEEVADESDTYEKKRGFFKRVFG